MSSGARAAIDIGSNSLLLTVVDADGAIAHDEARVVGLGRGLGDRGLFRSDRLAAAEEVLRAYVAVAVAHGVAPEAIRAVATSAARRAINAETFFARIARELGLRVRIISGEDEARLTWLGAVRDLPVPQGIRLVVDLGGGSTELVLGDDDRIVERTSLEIGSVRLTESHLCRSPGGPAAGPRGGGDIPDRFDPAGIAALRRDVEVMLARITIRTPPEVVIGVAGTATTLAAMALGLDRYDAGVVHGASLTRVDLGRFIDALGRGDRAERVRLSAVSPERADYLLAGAVVLDRVLATAHAPRLVASDRGLRFGLLGLTDPA